VADQTTERFVFIGMIGAVTFGFLSQALKLQRGETDRRLDGLNNEAARLKAAVALNVSADTWEGFQTNYRQAVERTLLRFETIEKFQNKMLGAIAIAAVLVPAITAIVVYLLTRHAVPVGK